MSTLSNFVPYMDTLYLYVNEFLFILYNLKIHFNLIYKMCHFNVKIVVIFGGI